MGGAERGSGWVVLRVREWVVVLRVREWVGDAVSEGVGGGCCE